MAQQLSFQVFGKLSKLDLCRASSSVVRRASEEKQSFRDFREWMRGQGLWDKEKTPDALAFLGVSTKPVVGISNRSQGLLNAEDSVAESEALFTLLREANLLLLKVVLEALDTETGGRLHSTHELHRMLTSYVYPGQHIPLVDFQAWLVWAEAAQAIRMVGIRWGLGELGKANMEWFRARDVDEILEDEEEEAAEEQEAPVPLRVIEPSNESLGSNLSDTDVEQEPEVAAVIPMETPAEQVEPAESAEADSLHLDDRDEDAAESSPATAASAPVAPPALSGVVGGDEVLRWLRGEQVSWGGPSDFSASEIGISIPMGGPDEARWMAEMATASVWVAQGIPLDWAFAAMGQFQGDEVFRRLANGEGLTAALSPVEHYLGKPALVRLTGAMVLAAACVAQLHKTPELFADIRDDSNPLSRYEKVHRLCLGEAYPVGAFWWVRQADSQGVWHSPVD